MERSPILDGAAGARLSGDGTTILTFGDVPAEYRAGTQGAVLFDATVRGRVEASGVETAAFLHRLLANDVKKQEVGTTRRNLLLSAKGKVLYDFEIAREAERFELSLAFDRAAPFLKQLDMYLFAEKVKLADTSSTHAPLELCGPKSDEVVRRALGIEIAPDSRAFARATFGSGAVRAERLAVAGSPGWRVDAGPELAGELWKALVAAGAQPAGVVVRDILRVEAGAAAWGADIDENVYPQEARLEAAFSLDKGCYIGQEVVAKIDTYGGLNKRLVALKVSHDDPIARGTRLNKLDDGEWRDLGIVTSWAYSFVHDTGLVLAYVKRRHQAIGTEFRVGDGPATATIVPIPVRAGAVPVTGEFE